MTAATPGEHHLAAFGCPRVHRTVGFAVSTSTGNRTVTCATYHHHYMCEGITIAVGDVCTPESPSQHFHLGVEMASIHFIHPAMALFADTARVAPCRGSMEQLTVSLPASVCPRIRTRAEDTSALCTPYGPLVPANNGEQHPGRRVFRLGPWRHPGRIVIPLTRCLNAWLGPLALIAH